MFESRARSEESRRPSPSPATDGLSRMHGNLGRSLALPSVSLLGDRELRQQHFGPLALAKSSVVRVDFRG